MSIETIVSGTEANPTFIEGPIESIDDLRLTRRFFLYETPDGLVSGTTFNIRFTVDAVPGVVWPVFKDLNLWQNSHHRYSGVVGDLEGKSFRIANVNSPDRWLSSYDVIRVIPEHLMVFSQPIVDDARIDAEMKKLYGGGVSPGFHAFMLSPREQNTDVWIQMEHARRARNLTVDESLAPWRQLHPASREKWRNSFVPTLKRLASRS
ncbi:MAG TPA: hypothetical protein VJP06_06660 [Thermoplasmata archaeon]|nr:hypothetical protein [Thermoplasmata archaeon]